MISRWHVVVLVATLMGTGCDEGMVEQPKRQPYEPSPSAAFPANLQPPAGAVPRSAPASERPPADTALLQHGQRQFEIFYTPCHGQRGDADGAVVQAGFPKPPSYHSARVRSLSASHIYKVITDGFGVMYGYGDRIAPRERWAIIAYIRALQLARLKPDEYGDRPEEKP